jgi:nucleoside-diphosphate-sugar epimerase
LRKILVTGPNGFIGSHICETLVGSGLQVRAMVRHTSDLSNLKEVDVELVYGDLNDYDSLKKAIDGVSAIVNNGGLTKTLDPSMFFEVNARGTGNILKAAYEINPRLEKFVQVSSTAACGPSDSMTPINEKDSPRPITEYGRSKLEGERAVLDFKDKFPVVILRPSAVYGPRDGEMLSFFKMIKYGLKPTFGTGECYINFTFVRDFARAVVKTLETDVDSGEVFFITEKKRYSYSEAGDIISEIMGKRALDIHIPRSIVDIAGWISENIAQRRNKAVIFTRDKANEISQKYWLVDSGKSESQLGFAAPTSFREGALETVKWYRENGWL